MDFLKNIKAFGNFPTQPWEILKGFNTTPESSSQENVVQTIGDKQVSEVSEMKQLCEILSSKLKLSLLYLYCQCVVLDNHHPIESISIQVENWSANLSQWLNLEFNMNDPGIQNMHMDITRSILAGLTYRHDNKITYRDLKPENIMLSKIGYQCFVKIGDFDLCQKIHHEETAASTPTSLTGTQDYMKNEYSFQADLFPLGLMIWEAVQLISFQNKKNMFDRIVYENGEGSVVGQSQMGGVKETIIRLTKWKIEKKKVDRIQSADESSNYSDQTGQKFTAKNSEELKLFLKNVANGGSIQLLNREYVGVFVLKQDNVRICGVEGTVLKLVGGKAACLTIVGNACIVSRFHVVAVGNRGIKFTGLNNEVKNITFMGGNYSLEVNGDENKMQDLNISNAFRGMWIQGCQNIVEGVEMDSVAEWGIYVADMSNENSLSNISFRNVKYGIGVEGSNNSIFNVNLIKNTAEGEFWGVELWVGSHNSNIENLKCTGYKRSKKDWGLRIYSDNCCLRNSSCGPILVEGNNVTFTNVECGELSSIAGEGVKLVKCRGKKLQTSKKVAIIECDFDVPDIPTTITEIM